MNSLEDLTEVGLSREICGSNSFSSQWNEGQS